MRRLLSLTAIALAIPVAAARADVFVPADPPRAAADCIAAAGDVVATTRVDRRGRSVVELSEAGGPRRRLERARLHACPLAAAAGDGTAAITTSSRVRVRRPGGMFGGPVDVGFEPADVAAAPGGWVAVVGELDKSLVVATIAPDGRVASQVVDHGDRVFLSPHVGIDARGVATAAWTRWNAGTGVYALRTSHAGTVATGTVECLYECGNNGQIDVAVAPSGRVLLAWADGHGVKASVDGGPAKRLTTARDAGSPAAAIADSGAAVVGYAGHRERVFANDRAPGGAWSARHDLSAVPPRNEGDEPVPMEREVLSAVGPDGRAAVAWRGYDAVGSRIFAASGVVGGGWAAGAGLSLITRQTRVFSLSLGAAGDPRVLWAENPGRVRAARLAPASGPPDRTVPVVATRLPTRTPRTRNAHVRLRVPVRCSEACDVRVGLVYPQLGLGLPAATRNLQAGKREVLTLRVGGFLARKVLALGHDWRPRIELLATDRAGNVVRRTTTVRFRIAPRPLLSYRVAATHDFAMFSRAGDRAVARLVNTTIEALAAHEITSQRELRRRFQRGLRAIERDHDEVFDTEVLDAIFEATLVPFSLAGFDAEDVLSA